MHYQIRFSLSYGTLISNEAPGGENVMKTEIKTVDPARRTQARQDLPGNEVAGKVSVEVRADLRHKAAKPRAGTAATSDSHQAVIATGTQEHSIDGWRKQEQKLPNKKWATRLIENTVTNRSRMIIFLICADSFVLVTTALIFLLQGFHYKGFNLDASLLQWLGAAGLGEVAGLVALAIKLLFK